MTTQTLELDDLVGLIGDLRLAGYDIGTQQYINAQRLLLMLAAQGCHPERARDLCTLLAPILCSSAREQENFYKYFSRWLARHPRLASQDKEAADKEGSDAVVRHGWLDRSWLWLRGHALLLSVAAVVLLAALVLYLLTPSRTLTLSGVVVSADQNSTSVPNAQLTLARQSAAFGAPTPSQGDTLETTADAQGKFTFNYRTQDTPLLLTARAEGFEIQTQVLTGEDLRAPVTVRLTKLMPTPEEPAPGGQTNGSATVIPPPREREVPPTTVYKIGGRLTEAGRGLGGVTVTVTTPSAGESESRVVSTSQTDADGRYLFESITQGASYVVRASRDRYTFEPQEHRFNNLASDQIADFVATRYAPALAFTLLRLLAGALPLLLFAAWWLWRLYRHRRILMRKSRSERPPRLEHLTVKGAPEQLFQSQAFRRMAQELRRHRQHVSYDLDEKVTIEATVKRGGLFTPFYGSRKTLPEYLALIERVGPRDQMARFQEELVRRLVQDSVIIDQYHFRGDPRYCRRGDDGAALHANYVSLPDLAALHPDYFLLVFSDGAGFINSVSGEPENWLEQFAHWPGRALLTPQSPAHWRAREWALQEADFLVLPVGREGLEALGEAINMGAPPDIARLGEGRSRPFPEMLREHPRRWLEDHELPPAKVTQLVGQLTDYLGADGMSWLAACAVYPALHWDLTLYLGFELMETREEFERKLLAVVSLPWLRYGVMPDWLRTRLISTLTPDAESAIRGALERLLVTVLDPPPDGVRLDYSTRRDEPPPSGLKGFWLRLREQLRRRGRRRTLRDLFRTEEDDSPLKDFVFLTFMSGRRPRRLDFSVPDLLRRLLFPRGQRTLGLRPATSFALAAAVSLVGWQVVSRVYSRELEPVESPGRRGGTNVNNSNNANANNTNQGNLNINTNRNANASSNANQNANTRANVNRPPANSTTPPANNRPVNVNSNANSPANSNSSQTPVTEVDSKIKQILIDELGVQAAEVKSSARLVNDLGADSLDGVELVMRVEEEFGIEVPDEDCGKWKTVGDVSRYISKKLSERPARQRRPGRRSRGGNTNSGGDSNANSNDGGTQGGNANTGETPTRNVNSGAPVQIAYSRAAAGGVTIVRFEGNLVGAAASGRLKSYISTLISKKKFKVVLDLGGVTEMDDHNLQQIASQESALRKRGGRLVLLNVSKKLRDLLKITQMLTVFDTYEDEDEAVKSFQP